MKAAGLLPEVIIIGEFPFPYGTAASNNLRGHCRALRTAGFSVGLLPRSDDTGEEAEAEKSYGEMPYWQVGNSPPEPRNFRLLRCYLSLDDHRINWLRGRGLAGVKAVIAYPGIVGVSAFLLRLRHLCARHSIPILSLVVEWHDSWYIRGKYRLLTIGDTALQVRAVNRLLNGTICISTYLRNYYARKGQRAICIPPLLDLSEPKWQVSSGYEQSDSDRRLRLLFCGSPDRDRHDLMLRAVLKMRHTGHDINIEYLGSTRNELAKLLGNDDDLLNRLGNGVHFHGRVPEDQVARVMRSASFGVLLRDDARWSKSCFPSRVPEFSALGVPMLCNLSSDLGSYLKDGQNAIVVPDVTVEGFCSALQKALRLSADAFHSMRGQAKEMARSFDAVAYAQSYRDLLQQPALQPRMQPQL
jgi:glycosyltransferase involved in cell wall biosynthesis